MLGLHSKRDLGECDFALWRKELDQMVTVGNMENNLMSDIDRLGGEVLPDHFLHPLGISQIYVQTQRMSVLDKNLTLSYVAQSLGAMSF